MNGNFIAEAISPITFILCIFFANFAIVFVKNFFIFFDKKTSKLQNSTFFHAQKNMKINSKRVLNFLSL